MILIPAIDVRGGRAVRLRQGDFACETVYADDPLAAARDFAAAGASWLHVVDLDGARGGEPANLSQLRRIAGEPALSVQYGGGLRTLDAVRQALEAGAARVVLGTAALSDHAFLREALRRWGNRVVVAVDVRGGEVAVAGWTKGSATAPEEAIERVAGAGAGRLLYTAVDRDGMLAGPDQGALRRVAAAAGRLRILYSGGVGSLEDLSSLRGLGLPALEGVIAGKALYEGRFTLAEGQAALDAASVLR